MAIDSWEQSSELWDTLILNDAPWPGIWSVDTSGATRDIETKKSRGRDGINLKDQGYNATSLTLTGRILASEWEPLQTLIDTIHPRRKGSIREPISIVHPIANVIGVDQIYIQTIQPKMPSNGIGELVLKAIEWFPAPKPVKTKKPPPEPPHEHDGGGICGVNMSCSPQGPYYPAPGAESNANQSFAPDPSQSSSSDPNQSFA